MVKSSTRLVLICGLPASGKTTLARRLAVALPAIRLDKDEWTMQLGRDVWDDEFRVRLERQLWALTLELLAGGPVKRAAKVRLDPPGKVPLGLQRQFVVDVHLVPGDLVDHHHRPDRAQPVEGLPRGNGLLLHRQRGNLRHARGQFPHNCDIFLV